MEKWKDIDNLVLFLEYMWTSQSWALLEKPPVTQLLKKFPKCYGTWKFITVFTRALHWSLLCHPILSRIHFNIVACRLIARQRPINKWDKQFLLSSHQRANVLAEEWLCGNPNRHRCNNGTATEKRCFLLDPCKVVIRATLFLGDINTGTLPSRLGESWIWDSKIWSQIPWYSDPRMTVLARTSSKCKLQTRSLREPNINKPANVWQ
jgi:hypothetical protein